METGGSDEDQEEAHGLKEEMENWNRWQDALIKEVNSLQCVRVNRCELCITCSIINLKIKHSMLIITALTS